jgi:plasmid maintenance system antidote protein VapI
MKNKKETKLFHELVKEHLNANGTKQSWLAEKTNLSDSHISNVLANRVLLTDDVRKAINDVLGTNY